MSGYLRTIARAVTPVVRRQTVTQTANIYSKPAKDKLGPVENLIGLGMMSLAILGPSGWILAHLEDYKSKD